MPRSCEHCGGVASAAARHCQWCGRRLRELESFESLYDVDGCPVCGEPAADVSWQTAPGQEVCTTDSCPVNTWNDRLGGDGDE